MPFDIFLYTVMKLESKLYIKSLYHMFSVMNASSTWMAVLIDKTSGQIECVDCNSRFRIDPYFFDENEATVNINSERYSSMLSKFLFPRLKQNRKLSTTIFQQDGASAHVFVCAKAVIQRFWRSSNFSPIWY